MSKRHRFKHAFKSLLGGDDDDDKPAQKPAEPTPTQNANSSVSRVGESKPVVVPIENHHPQQVLNSKATPSDDVTQKKEQEPKDASPTGDVVISNVGPDENPQQKNLWEEAYNRLRAKDLKLVEAYEKDLLTSNSQTSLEDGIRHSANENQGEDREEQLKNLVEDKLEAIRNSQLKVTVAGEEIVIKDQIRKVVHTIVEFKDFIGATVSAEPHAALAWAGVVMVLPLLCNPFTQLDDATDGLEYISELLVRCRVIEITYDLSSEKPSQRALTPESQKLLAQIRAKTIDLYVQILTYQISVARQYSRGGVFRFLRDFVLADNWKEMLSGLQGAEESISKDLKTFDSNSIGNIDLQMSKFQIKADDILSGLNEVRSEVEIIKQEQQLAKLVSADYASFDAFEEDALQPSKCYEGTRIEILQDIKNWGLGHDENCIFWLSGMAGTGKSTIARTVASSFHDQKRLAGSFFFSRNKGLRAKATAFFTTLAGQLAETVPDITPYISRAIIKHNKINEKPLSEQWDLLIFEPLLALSDRILTPLVLVFVIDALDECKGTEHIPEILRLLGKANSLKIIQLRIFITSRRESYIQSSFDQIPGVFHRDLLLDPSLDEQTERDVSLYLRHELGEVAKSRSLKNWPTEDDTNKLIHRAGRLFIYAATVCRYLQKSKYPAKRLPEMLDVTFTGHSSTKELDNMYMLILRQPIEDCCEEDREDVISLFKSVVGSIVLLSEALSSGALSELLEVPSTDIISTLEPLHSVLNAPNDEKSPIQIFHLSFHDFLLDNKRCTDLQLWIDEELTHKSLFENCLRVMSDHLKMDICELEKPGTLASEVDKSRIEANIPAAARYACRYFVSHLQGAKIIPQDGDQLHLFLQKYLLYWLETLSLLGKISEAVLAITSLESIVTAKESPDLYAMIYDAKRFILYNRLTIEEAPLQLYSSALIFTPERSITRNHFKDQISHLISRVPKVQKDWSALEQTLEGHARRIKSVGFSLDGTKLASGSEDRSVRVWNVATGQMEQTLVDQIDEHRSVAFSPNGSKAAVASTEIQVWDIATARVEHIFDGFSGRITCLSFSYDGHFLASGSDMNSTIRIWDLSTGQIVHILEDQSGFVTKLAFRHDGKILASGTQSKSISIWDTTTGQIKQTLEDPSGSIVSIAFSHDGSKLASGSFYSTISIWNMATGEAEQTIREIGGGPSGLSFSYDGTRIAARTGDNTIQIWKVATGEVEQILRGHASPVSCLAFSPDGSRLASGSEDKTVRIWNVSAERAEQIAQKEAEEKDGSEEEKSEHTFGQSLTAVMKAEFAPLDPGADPRSMKGFATYALDRSRTWVTRNGERLLYLPLDYRPGNITATGQNLVILPKNRAVQTITFQTERKAR